MGLVEVQTMMASLFTDASVRERFLTAPMPLGREYGLTGEETSQVALLSATRLHLFAVSLISKRRQEVEKLLPLTCRALGERFTSTFARYAYSPIPAGVHKHRDDAIAFATFLEDDSTVEWAIIWGRDMACYERSWLETVLPDRRWLVCAFRYPLGRLTRHRTEGDTPPDLAPRSSLGLWFRWRREAPMRHLLLSLPSWLCIPHAYWPDFQG